MLTCSQSVTAMEPRQMKSAVLVVASQSITTCNVQHFQDVQGSPPVETSLNYQVLKEISCWIKQTGWSVVIFCPCIWHVGLI